MELSVDLTFFAQLAIFLFTILILDFGIFKPILKVLEERKKLTSGAAHESVDLEKETLKLNAQVELQLRDARDKGLQSKDESVRQGEKAREARLSKARQEMEVVMGATRKQIDEEAKQAASRLQTMTEQVSQEVVTKILQREV